MSNKLIVNPHYTIYVKGKALKDKYYSYVNGISVKYTSIGSNICTISIQDPDFEFIEGTCIVESTPIKVVFGVDEVQGYIKKAQRTFEGYVSVIDCDFPESGLPTVTIHCMDKTHLMNRKKKTRTWQNTTASAVANKIFREYGFKTVIHDSKTKLESIEQSDVTDIEFVIKLAQDVEDKVFLTYIEGETAYFVERQAPKPKVDLVYRQAPYSLLSFRPRINKESKKEVHVNMEINLKTLKIEQSVVDPKAYHLGNSKVQNSSSRK